MHTYVNMDYLLKVGCSTPIDDLTDLAKAFYDTTIIFNHLGGPIGVESYAGRRDEVFAAWKLSVAELAKCPNVVAKLGGLQMVVNGYDWHGMS